MLRLLALLAATIPLAHAQTTYRIGLLNEGRNVELQTEVARALAQRDYVEGKNLVLEARSSMGDGKVLRQAAEEFVRLKLDAVIATSTRPAVVMRELTSTVPIIVSTADAVGAGLVASLARPGGNVTGVLTPLADLAAKRVQLFKELLPNLTRATVLWNPEALTTDRQFVAVRAAARPLGIAIDSVETRSAADLDRALAAMAANPPQAVIVLQSSLLLNASERLAPFALKHRIPISHPYRRFPDAGGLFSYGSTAREHQELMAMQLDKILKGAKPAEVPVVLPERFELVINAKTAQALGIQIPRGLLMRATEVLR
jgi:putative ABC transport system substrate-binding protein